MVYANACEIDITPPLGTIINGEFTARYATQIADPLFAKAIYLHTHSVSQLYLMVDTCVMRKEFLDPIKAEIEELIGIPKDQQLIASTHTHYAGSVEDLLLAPADIAYREFLRSKIIELAKKVTEIVQPVKIGFGKIEKPEHLTCRRYRMKNGFEAFNPVSHKLDSVKTNPFGSEDMIVERTTIPDPEVCYVSIKTMDNRHLALLANYSLHYVGDCPRATISADYFGYFANRVKSSLQEDDMIVMMSNGTSGEVNIWDFIEGDRYPKEMHAKSRLIGEDLADAVCSHVGFIDYDADVDLDVAYSKLTLGVRTLTEDLLKEAYATLQQTDYEGLSFEDVDLMRKVYAREQVLLTAYPETVSFSVQCFRIGNIIIGGLGGEFFSQTGKYLKSKHPQYFSICLANDYVGYVPPKDEFENGGYETWRARSSFLSVDAEQQISTKMEELIQTLKPL